MTGRRDDFLEDTRARIPFALIAVLLLVVSQSIIVVLATRDEATVDRDPQLAMERTDDATQTALVGAVREATIRAGREPVLEAADSPYGRALTPPGETPDTADSDEVFERYVRLLIYLEARERLQRTNQTVRGETRTNVTLEPIRNPSDAEDAIDSVSLYVGNMSYGEATSESVGYGNVRVTIEDVTVRMTRDQELLDSRSRDISATVATPIFDLHNRTQEYERQLNTDFGGPDRYRGLGDYVGARAYPFAWARGYAQSRGEPVANVLSERHLEVLANEGVYAAQRSVYGNPDRFDDPSLTRAWGATLAQDNRGMYVSPTGGSGDVDNVGNYVNDSGFVDGANYTYRNVNGSLSDSPDWTQLASQNDYLNQTHRVNLSNAAQNAFGNMTSERGIDAAINRTYRIDVGTETSVEKDVSVGDDDEITDLISRTVSVESVDRVLATNSDDRQRDYYRIHLVFTGDYLRNGGAATPTSSTVRYDLNVTVTGEHSTEALVDRRGVDYDYVSGPSNVDSVPFDTNFQYDENGEDIPQRAVEASIAGVSDFENLETQLEEHIRDETTDADGIDSDSVLSESDLIDIVTEDDPSVMAEPADREQLRGWIIDDLHARVNETGNVSTAVERHRMLAGDSPFRNMETQITGASSNATYVYAGTGDPYRSAAEKALAEARLAYMERLRTRVNTSVQRHESRLAELDSEITAHTGSSLNDSVRFARAQFARDPNARTYVQESDRLGRIRETPNAAPNYMTFGRVDLQAVSATGTPPEGFVPMAGRAENVYASPYDRSDVALRVAGGVLEAGNRTDSLTNDSSWDDGHLTALNSSLDNDIDRIIDRAAVEGAAPFPSVQRADIEPLIRDEVERLGPTERQAIRLGSGRGTLDRIAGNVSRQIEPPSDGAYFYLRSDFNQQLNSSIRYGFREAIEREQLSSTTASETDALGSRIRTELGAETETVIEERLSQAASESLANTTTTPTAADWLEGRTDDSAIGDLNGTTVAPNRNPSGVHVPGMADWNELTANIWHVTLRGEYARFTVHAAVGTTAGPDTARYTREDTNVTLRINGRERLVGSNEKLTFESDVSVLVAVPDERLGVGDRAGPALDCSASYDTVGPIANRRVFNGC